MARKAMTLRLDEEQAARLDAVARADGISVTKVVRDAIDAHIEVRRNDEEFQDRIERMMKEEHNVLKGLAK